MLTMTCSARRAPCGHVREAAGFSLDTFCYITLLKRAQLSSRQRNVHWNDVDGWWMLAALCSNNLIQSHWLKTLVSGYVIYGFRLNLTKSNRQRERRRCAPWNDHCGLSVLCWQPSVLHIGTELRGDACDGPTKMHQWKWTTTVSWWGKL